MKRFLSTASIFILLLFVPDAYAKATTYTVKKGDSIDKISHKLNIPASLLKDTNNLKSNRLRTGMRLVVPDTHKHQKSARKQKSAEDNSLGNVVSGGNKASSRVSEPAAKNVSPANTNVLHVVKKGETLKSIARKYSITVSELKEMNDLGGKRLRSGRQLIVKKEGPQTYIVKKRDTIWKIARKFNKKPTDLIRLNDLGDGSLKLGQEILLEELPAGKESEDNVADIKEIYSPQAVVVKPSTRLAEVMEMSHSEDLSELSMRERLILFAKKMLHLPYRFGGNGTIGLDCSAYVQKVYEIAGVSLPRSARQQFQLGESIDRQQLSTGDLVFFRTYASFPSHVGIYLGNNLFIHASSRSKKVTIDSLETPYYLRRFIGAKRVIASEGEIDIPDKES